MSLRPSRSSPCTCFFLFLLHTSLSFPLAALETALAAVAAAVHALAADTATQQTGEAALSGTAAG